ncbi:hypothetical protein EVA_05033 [gut metagenome]|uniref:Uncharacterized protein n=1 Tax=gut metagenome TaxID=749906 RepID=J9GVD5_9ZZZZ
MRIYGVVGQGNGHVRLPRAGEVLLAQEHVAFLALQVVEGRHAEVHQYSITLHDGSQQRFGARTHQGTQVDVTFADVARQRRADDGIAQFQFGLVQVGAAHAHRCFGGLVGSNGIVQVQLAGRILFIQRSDTFQVALGLQRLCLVLLQLGASLVCLGAVLVLVDDEQHLVLVHVGTFGKLHLFQIAFHTGTHFDELLGAHTAYVFAVDFDVILSGGSNDNSGKFGLGRGTTGGNQIDADYQADTYYCNGCSFLLQRNLFLCKK